MSSNINGLTEQEFLKQYNAEDYPKPSVAVDIVIFTITDSDEDNYRKLSEKELRVLLIRRGGHPFKGQWALPGGFVRPGETVGEASERELAEETGVTNGYLEQLYTFSKPGRDPRTWVISCAHMALADINKIDPKAGSDAEEAKWFSVYVSDIPGIISMSLQNEETILTAVLSTESNETEPDITANNGLAFDHAKIISAAIQRMRGKLEYTDLAFCLMPEKFTLTELQQVYETILGRSLYKAAFRRKIKDLVEETDQYTIDKGHRPAKLFMKRKTG